MSEAILDPRYWARRLREAPIDSPHWAIFKEGTAEDWLRIEHKHREILAKYIVPGDWVLDVGCGWGRLLTLMPKEWLTSSYSYYTGVDISLEFIAKAHDLFGGDKCPMFRHRCHFLVGDIRSYCNQTPQAYDWAVMISIRPMVQRHLGGEEWDGFEERIRSFARKLLYLEYDEHDEGSVE